ncbi:MAG: RNA polymerase sigma factor [Rubripirellula sp.]
MPSDHSLADDGALIAKVKSGDQLAWKALIDRFEGRLLAYVNCRVNNRTTSEDIVQEAFIGFLKSLPNYDEERSLESYLFSICAYKLTDYLRREGRRPALQLRHKPDGEASDDMWVGNARLPSSIARSAEQKKIEERVISEALQDQIKHWKTSDQWTKLMAIELIFVKGLGNQEVAKQLSITEQQVANYKSDFQTRLKRIIHQMNLESEVFPELTDTP